MISTVFICFYVIWYNPDFSTVYPGGSTDLSVSGDIFQSKSADHLKLNIDKTKLFRAGKPSPIHGLSVNIENFVVSRNGTARNLCVTRWKAVYHHWDNMILLFLRRWHGFWSRFLSSHTLTTASHSWLVCLHVPGSPTLHHICTLQSVAVAAPIRFKSQVLAYHAANGSGQVKPSQVKPSQQMFIGKPHWFTSSSFWMCDFQGKPSNPMKEIHFGKLYSWFNYFGLYPKLMTIGEGLNVHQLVNQELFL